MSRPPSSYSAQAIIRGTAACSSGGRMRSLGEIEKQMPAWGIAEEISTFGERFQTE
jgi:hypothetical protein